MSEFSPLRFQILPPVIKNIIIITGLVFLAQNTFGLNGTLFFNNYFALHSIRSDYFNFYQIITHLFLHADFSHILLNLFALWVFGGHLENYMGSIKFFNFFIICGICAAMFHLAYLYAQQQPLIEALYDERFHGYYTKITQRLDTPTVGMSGAVFGCMAAYAYFFPNTYLYIYFILPVQTKWVITIFILTEIGALIYGYVGTDTATDNVAHVAHLGGALVGFLYVFLRDKIRKK